MPGFVTKGKKTEAVCKYCGHTFNPLVKLKRKYCYTCVPVNGSYSLVLRNHLKNIRKERAKRNGGLRRD